MAEIPKIGKSSLGSVQVSMPERTRAVAHIGKPYLKGTYIRGRHGMGEYGPAGGVMPFQVLLAV
jgi:hypothetical protein